MPYIGKPQSADAFRVTPSNIDSALKGAVSGSNDSEMTLATASIAAITASISRIDSEIDTNAANITLATASIAAITASLGQPVNTDSNVTFGTITSGDINSTGTITATEIHTTFVSSSIAVSSGSNIFGDDTADSHQFTGSVDVSGSLFVKDGLLTVTDNVDFNGDLDVDGTTNLDVVDIDGAVDMASTLAVGDAVTVTKAIAGSSGDNFLLNIVGTEGSGTDLGVGDNVGILFKTAYETTTSKIGSAIVATRESADDTISSTGLAFKVSQNDETLDTALTISSSGHVGIGTTSPSNIFHSHGLTHRFSSDSYNVVYIQADANNDGSNDDIALQFTTGNSNTVKGELRYDESDDKFEISAGDNQNHLVISSSGHVGLGTTSPSDHLHVKETGGGDAVIKVDNNAYYMRIDQNSVGSTQLLTFKTGASLNDRMRITSDGKVGIGTTSPAGDLEITAGDEQVSNGVYLSNNRNANNNEFIYFRKARGSSVPSSGDTIGEIGFQVWDGDEYHTGARIDSTVAGSISNNAPKANLIFKTIEGSDPNPAERMRIESTGVVYIGDTANGNMGQGLTINQNAHDDEILAFKSSDVNHSGTSILENDTYAAFSKTSGTQGGLMITAVTEGTYRAIQMQVTTDGATNTAKSTGGYGVVDVDVHQGDFGGVTTNGNLMSIGASNVTRFLFDNEGSGHADVEWTTYSDGRLKKNVEDIPYGLNELNKLEPKIYDRYSGKLEDGKVKLEDNSFRQIGFIAQDVKKIIPELIKDIDESESFYSLDDGKLVSVLVKAVQELSSQVTDLKKEIEDLKG